MNEVPVRLLRETLQARGSAAPSSDCLDAETIAAWADRTLGRDERRAVETHAADCGRCQALIVAMARTSPPAAVRSWWRTPMMGWVVPLTAVAAGLLVWMIVPGTAPQSTNAPVSRVIAPELPDPSLGAAPSRQLDTSQASSAMPVPPTVSDQERTQAKRTNLMGPRAQNSAPEAAVIAPPDPQVNASAGAAGAASAPPPSPMPPAPPTAGESAAPQAAKADAAAGAGPPLAGPQAAAARIEALPSAALALDVRRPAVVIVSPNPASQWRIVTGGTVQHTNDGGLTWNDQPTGVGAMLTAGASPAASVCWMVGPQGTVLLTADGRSWRRLRFPETVDLTSIRATDEMIATVVAADGRTFSTIDGGQSWTR